MGSRYSFGKTEIISKKHYFSRKHKTMRLTLSLLLPFIGFASIAQELVFNKALIGDYENPQFSESMRIVEAGEGDSDPQKNEVFTITFNKDQEQGTSYVFRDMKGSQLGEWYSTADGKIFIRFSMNNEGEVIADMGNDPNYDQVIDVKRTFTFHGDVNTGELEKFIGKTNKEQINGNVMGEQSRLKCEAEKTKLKEYFIENEEADIYETKGQRLYVVSQVYGSHETMKGVLIKYTDLDGSYEITHKVDIWYQPNKDDYGCAFQIFKCGEKTKLERYTVTVSDDKSMITLNGEGFKKVEN